MFSTLLGQAAWSPAIRGQQSAGLAQVHVEYTGRSTIGTAVLVGRQDRDHDVVLHFLTSARIFHVAVGEPDARPHVTLDLDDRQTVAATEVIVSPSRLVEVAIVRTVAEHTTLAPQPIAYDAPWPGEPFRVIGYAAGGNVLAFEQRVRFHSTRLILGDWGLSGLVGCQGAPAISSAGVFGVVSECASNQVAVVSQFAFDRWFIERHISRVSVTTTDR
jgi:hypothetical protein